MKVLVACEFSGVVRDAFAIRGHDAWSCDLLPTEAPGQHIQGDVLRHLDEGWDLMIAHPPCTDLAISGARWFRAKREDDRQAQSVAFFMRIVTAPIPKICVENPVSIMSTVYRAPDQIIHPYYFGDEQSKTTCLWLKHLHPLIHAEEEELFYHKTHVKPRFVVSPRTHERFAEWAWKTGGGSGKKRSVTYPGIARAMAEQWG
jgi:site-specific DNA-cytosine methylase